MAPRRKAIDPFAALSDPELLAYASDEELKAIELWLAAESRARGNGEVTPWPKGGWREVLNRIVPLSSAMAPEHESIWTWIINMSPDKAPEPIVICLPRGRGKSTHCEAGSIALAAHGIRDFIWYVSATQDQANKHLESIAGILESPLMARWYPDLHDRKIGIYGQQKGWRRNRIWTAAGAVWEAVGLDTGSRGARVEDRRPGLIVIDDVDDHSDSPETVEKRREMLAKAVIPAGSDRAAIMFPENMVHANSLMARVVHPEEFEPSQRWLLRRRLIGPVPAIEGLEVDEVMDEELGYPVPTIVAGTPTWPEGQPLEVLQGKLWDGGYSAFMEEYQHSTEPPEGGIFAHVRFRRIEAESLPKLVERVVAIDPAVTETDRSDSVGIVAGGVDQAGYIYALWAHEKIISVTQALRLGLWAAWKYDARTVLIETNQGADLWRVNWDRVLSEAVAIAPATDLGALPFVLELARLRAWDALTEVDSRSIDLRRAIESHGKRRLDASGVRNRLGVLHDQLEPTARAWIESHWEAGGAQFLDGLAESHKLLAPFVKWRKDGGSIFAERPAPRLLEVKAPSTKTKAERIGQMTPDYERGDVLHVIGDWNITLERALKRFPTEPDDLADAARHFWGYCRKIRRAPGLRTGGPTGNRSGWTTPGGKGASNGAGSWSMAGINGGGWDTPT